MDISYTNECTEYYKYALEQYLIEQEGYDDWDAAVAVAYDFKIIKNRYELYESCIAGDGLMPGLG
jgi:hypothetical protein